MIIQLQTSRGLVSSSTMYTCGVLLQVWGTRVTRRWSCGWWGPWWWWPGRCSSAAGSPSASSSSSSGQPVLARYTLYLYLYLSVAIQSHCNNVRDGGIRFILRAPLTQNGLRVSEYTLLLRYTLAPVAPVHPLWLSRLFCKCLQKVMQQIFVKF